MPFDGSTHVPVIIIGGGQAGLSASYLLKERGIEHLIGGNEGQSQVVLEMGNSILAHIVEHHIGPGPGKQVNQPFAHTAGSLHQNAPSL